MKVSLSWLQTFIPIEMTAQKLSNALTMAGLEVSAVTPRFAYLDRVHVGRIRKVKDHPNADRLKICDVDIGDTLLSIVCGAPNVREGMLAPVALPGTRFPNDTLLEKGIIRGAVSEGMLCSEAELELGADTSGIMDLPKTMAVGETLRQALDLSDATLEIDLTPNRPDCLSIIGTAREIGALQNKHISVPEAAIQDSGREIQQRTSITVEAPELCPRYAARLVENITVAPSPFWLQDRLRSVGLRPINNIVDITNYILMEYGQPLHAFDFDTLAEKRIVVRTAQEGERFTTLDGKERTLSSDMLLICDGKKPVGIAGVMGGLNSEIQTKTTCVLIESAYFNPASIRKTAKTLGLSTDASHRFERGIDPEITRTALDKAAAMMVEMGGGRLAQGVIDIRHQLPEPPTLLLSVQETNRLLGMDFSISDIQKLLLSIEFSVSLKSDDLLSVTPPSFRVDVHRPEDLMEEVARLSGYDNIPTTSPLIAADARYPLKKIENRNRIKTIMTGFGFTEAINYSFMDAADCDRLRLSSNDSRRHLLRLLNPLSEDQAVMRSALVPGLIRSVHRNLFQQIKTVKLFEIGTTFIATDTASLPEETEMIGGIWTGSRMDPCWNVKETPSDFFDMKGVVEGLFTALKIEGVRYTTLSEKKCHYLKPGIAAVMEINESPLGTVGEIHPKVLKNFDIKQPAFLFEINLTRLYDLIPDFKKAAPVPKYPFVTRDVTVIIDKSIEADRLLDFVKQQRHELVETVYLFDMFTGKQIPTGKKSISFRVVYRSHKETLEDEVVNELHKEISSKLVNTFNAALPE